MKYLSFASDRKCKILVTETVYVYVTMSPNYVEVCKTCT